MVFWLVAISASPSAMATLPSAISCFAVSISASPSASSARWLAISSATSNGFRTLATPERLAVSSSAAVITSISAWVKGESSLWKTTWPCPLAASGKESASRSITSWDGIPSILMEDESLPLNPAIKPTAVPRISSQAIITAHARLAENVPSRNKRFATRVNLSFQRG